ncbi:MAG: Dephospho-CoA kinase [Myxococcaceae bacterium]|nr:Dephospho-CoA kinase [Myxococcaceae bacterium]
MTVPVVGLTGGIASGKSTVARAFLERGIPVVDADQLAREVVAPASEGLLAIRQAFGDGVLLPDGSLDRRAVGALVFADAALRMKLNAIVHPLVVRLSAERLAALQKETIPYMIYEAPLIVENGLHRTMRALIVVALEVPLQLERLMQRDGLDRAGAMSRIEAQSPLSKKLEAADFVIDNGQSLSSLSAQVDSVHAQLLARFAGAV